MDESAEGLYSWIAMRTALLGTRASTSQRRLELPFLSPSSCSSSRCGPGRATVPARSLSIFSGPRAWTTRSQGGESVALSRRIPFSTGRDGLTRVAGRTTSLDVRRPLSSPPHPRAQHDLDARTRAVGALRLVGVRPPDLPRPPTTSFPLALLQRLDLLADGTGHHVPLDAQLLVRRAVVQLRRFAPAPQPHRPPRQRLVAPHRHRVVLRDERQRQLDADAPRGRAVLCAPRGLGGQEERHQLEPRRRASERVPWLHVRVLLSSLGRRCLCADVGPFAVPTTPARAAAAA